MNIGGAGSANLGGGGAPQSGGAGGGLAGSGGAGGSGGGAVTAQGCPATQTPGTWQKVTPPTMKMTGDFINGPITANVDVVHPNEIYVEAQYDGTWKSTDCGVTWKKISTGTAPNSGRQWYTAIDRNPKRDPSKPPTMYTTYGFGAGGVYKSVDGGVTWNSVWNDNVFKPDGTTNISKDIGADVTGVMIVDPSGTDHLIAFLHGYFGTGNNNGVFESTDGGKKWIVHTSPYFAFQAHGDVVFPVDANTWVVNHGVGYPNSVFYRTTDAGVTWKASDGMFSGGSIGRAFSIVGSTIYAGSDFTSNMFKSPDNGITWAKVSTTGNQFSWVVATKTKLYASNMRDNPHILHASLTNDAMWTDDGNPSGMTSGGSQNPAVLFDGEHYVLIAPQEKGGLWRYVEP